MKRTRMWVAIAVAAATALYTMRVQAVGIISSADGPTAIFITTGINPWGVLTAAVVIATVCFFALEKENDCKGTKTVRLGTRTPQAMFCPKIQIKEPSYADAKHK